MCRYGLRAREEAAGLQLFLDYAAELGSAPRQRGRWSSSRTWMVRIYGSTRRRSQVKVTGRRPRSSAAEALELYRHAPTHAARPAGRRDPRPQASRAASSPTSSTATSTTRTSASRAATSARSTARRIERRLRPRLRRDLPEDRRDDRRRRQPAAAAGRAQPRPADRSGTRICSAPSRRAIPAFKLHALSPPEVLHISRLNQLPVPRR